MKRISRFISGAALASVFVAGMLAFVPKPASAKIVLQCSGGTCCTFDDTTGKIYDCHPA